MNRKLSTITFDTFATACDLKRLELRLDARIR
jgi:hypothetical protein